MIIDEKKNIVPVDLDDDGVDLRPYDHRLKQGEPGPPRRIGGIGIGLHQAPEKGSGDEGGKLRMETEDIGDDMEDAPASIEDEETLCEAPRWKKDRHQYSRLVNAVDFPR